MDLLVAGSRRQVSNRVSNTGLDLVSKTATLVMDPSQRRHVSTHIVTIAMISHMICARLLLHLSSSSSGSGTYAASRRPLIMPTGILAAKRGAEERAEKEASRPCEDVMKYHMLQSHTEKTMEVEKQPPTHTQT